MLISSAFVRQRQIIICKMRFAFSFTILPQIARQAKLVYPSLELADILACLEYAARKTDHVVLHRHEQPRRQSTVPSDDCSICDHIVCCRAMSPIAALLEGVKQFLKDKNFPRDRLFKERLISLRLYGGGDRLPKTRPILERLEQSFAHKEGIAFDQLVERRTRPQLGGDI